MTTTPSHLLILAALGAGSSLFLGCDDGATVADLPDWSDGYAGTNPDAGDGGSDDTGIEIPDDIDPITGFAMRVPNDLPYEARVHQVGDAAAACEIQLADDWTGYQDIDCIYETAELDLWGNGLDFELTVPEGACDYVVYHHYQYEAWEVGSGPSDVSYTVTQEGVLTDLVNARPDGSGACDYDYSYSDPLAPNCCLGTYTLTVTYESDGLGSPEKVEVFEGEPWNGRPSDCYAGASFIDPEVVLTSDGWPTGRIVFTDQSEYYKRFEWDELSSEYGTNVNLANYYNAGDHGGTMPAGFTGDWAQPDYLAQCYDNAEELIGEIRMRVREWNEVAEFEKDGNSGDPDTSGTEASSGTPINDRQDWADATPGNSTWINDAQ